MSEIELNEQLFKEDLFELFKQQLKKDFDGAGSDGEFALSLSADFAQIRSAIQMKIESLMTANNSLLSSLLYRIDISEGQLRAAQAKNSETGFPEVVAELIIKRILQKVILKKTFSK